jgi:FkbM family methyltransferase
MKYFLICLLTIFQAQAIQILTNIDHALHNGDNEQNITINGELDVIIHFIEEKMTIFDIGANIGEWSARVLERHPAAVIFAFEPNPRTFKSLERYFSSYKNAQCFCSGASNDNGKLPLFYWEPDHESVLSSLFKRPIVDQMMQTAPKMIEVDLQRLDDFCNEHNVHYIDFMKIDTEGSEWNVLQGARSLLEQQKIGVIQFEYGGCYIDARTYLKDVYNLLTSCGYTIYKIIPGALVKLSSWDHRLESFKLSNYLAVSIDIA